MSDKKLEDALVKVFNGLKNLQWEQEEKQYQKHWGERKFPFTLLEGLGSYTKADLDDIRKKLDLKNASSLKKSELIALLVERIPENIENLFSLWDIERFKILTNTAGNGGQIIVPNLEANQIEYFRDSGLVFTGTFEGNKIIAVPNEIIDPILDLHNN